MKNLAIAYNMQRKRRKMAQGGEVDQDVDQDKAKDFIKGFKGVFSKGGEVKGVHKTSVGDNDHPKNRMEKRFAGESEAGEAVSRSDMGQKYKDMAYAKHGKVIAELKSMPNPKLKGLASGGSVHGEGCMCPKCEGMADGGEVGALQEDDKDLNQHRVSPMDSDEDDIVDRIMMKRSKDMSGEARLAHGGLAEANDTDQFETSLEPNEFDYMVLTGGLEDDSSAGNEIGNKEQHEDREDIVSRIMASRRLKDKLPKVR